MKNKLIFECLYCSSCNNIITVGKIGLFINKKPYQYCPICGSNFIHIFTNTSRYILAELTQRKAIKLQYKLNDEFLDILLEAFNDSDYYTFEEYFNSLSG